MLLYPSLEEAFELPLTRTCHGLPSRPHVQTFSWTSHLYFLIFPSGPAWLSNLELYVACQKELKLKMLDLGNFKKRNLRKSQFVYIFCWNLWSNSYVILIILVTGRGWGPILQCHLKDSKIKYPNNFISDSRDPLLPSKRSSPLLSHPPGETIGFLSQKINEMTPYKLPGWLSRNKEWARNPQKTLKDYFHRNARKPCNFSAALTLSLSNGL
jgi:hypothetical protein